MIYIRSATRILCLRGQLDITEKLIRETNNSPILIGEQLPRDVKKRLANSRAPTGLNRDLKRFTLTPSSEHILRYSSTTRLIREAESSPKTAYEVNHLPQGTTPDRHAAHCQIKW